MLHSFALFRPCYVRHCFCQGTPVVTPLSVQFSLSGSQLAAQRLCFTPQQRPSTCGQEGSCSNVRCRILSTCSDQTAVVCWLSGFFKTQRAWFSVSFSLKQIRTFPFFLSHTLFCPSYLKRQSSGVTDFTSFLPLVHDPNLPSSWLHL